MVHRPATQRLVFSIKATHVAPTTAAETNPSLHVQTANLLVAQDPAITVAKRADEIRGNTQCQPSTPSVSPTTSADKDNTDEWGPKWPWHGKPKQGAAACGQTRSAADESTKVRARCTRAKQSAGGIELWTLLTQALLTKKAKLLADINTARPDAVDVDVGNHSAAPLQEIKHELPDDHEGNTIQAHKTNANTDANGGTACGEPPGCNGLKHVREHGADPALTTELEKGPGTAAATGGPPPQESARCWPTGY